MPTQEIDLHAIQLGDGYVATHAWVSDGPIVLISTFDGTHHESKARLDTQKCMFIDALPCPVSAAHMDQLVAAVVEAQGKLAL